MTAEPKPILSIQNLHAGFGNKEVLHRLNLDIAPRSITALIGPSGCGKSTFVRCLNRMHEVVTGAKVSGAVLLKGKNIYDADVDPVLVRRQVGMVFQRPNPFPSLSIAGNVLSGLKLNGDLKKSEAIFLLEKYLTMAALWEEVKENLDRSGASLSGGQQQRLCIARALAVNPEVLLMDEPCSALDPISTARIEQLIEDLKKDYTIVIVTHNMQQAARVSDKTAFLLNGDLVEFDDTKKIFKNPSSKLTEDYITGRFG